MRALRGPKASESDWGSAGGGRTVRVPDVAAGAMLGDIGDRLDEAATVAGIHPDNCSDNKDSEPEGLMVFAAEDGVWAVSDWSGRGGGADRPRRSACPG